MSEPLRCAQDKIKHLKEISHCLQLQNVRQKNQIGRIVNENEDQKKKIEKLQHQLLEKDLETSERDQRNDLTIKNLTIQLEQYKQLVSTSTKKHDRDIQKIQEIVVDQRNWLREKDKQMKHLQKRIGNSLDGLSFPTEDDNVNLHWMGSISEKHFRNIQKIQDLVLKQRIWLKEKDKQMKCIQKQIDSTLENCSMDYSNLDFHHYAKRDPIEDIMERIDQALPHMTSNPDDKNHLPKPRVTITTVADFRVPWLSRCRVDHQENKRDYQQLIEHSTLVERR